MHRLTDRFTVINVFPDLDVRHFTSFVALGLTKYGPKVGHQLRGLLELYKMF